VNRSRSLLVVSALGALLGASVLGVPSAGCSSSSSEPAAASAECAGVGVNLRSVIAGKPSQAVQSALAAVRPTLTNDDVVKLLAIDPKLSLTKKLAVPAYAKLYYGTRAYTPSCAPRTPLTTAAYGAALGPRAGGASGDPCAKEAVSAELQSLTNNASPGSGLGACFGAVTDQLQAAPGSAELANQLTAMAQGLSAAFTAQCDAARTAIGNIGTQSVKTLDEPVSVDVDVDDSAPGGFFGEITPCLEGIGFTLPAVTPPAQSASQLGADSLSALQGAMTRTLECEVASTLDESQYMAAVKEWCQTCAAISAALDSEVKACTAAIGSIRSLHPLDTTASTSADACVDPQTDPANCGSCGNACADCAAGMCTGTNPWVGIWPGETKSTCGFYSGPQTLTITSLGGNKLSFGSYGGTYNGNTATSTNGAVVFTLDGDTITGFEADSCQHGTYHRQK
jgi:hypothetical protein